MLPPPNIEPPPYQYESPPRFTTASIPPQTVSNVKYLYDFKLAIIYSCQVEYKTHYIL